MAQGYVNARTTDYSSLKSRLMGGASSRQRADHFDVLNRHLKAGLLMPGQLDAQLQGATRFGTGLRGNQSLKKVLGLSTRSYLHKGEIAGYAQRIRGIAQMSKWLGKGTYVGLALDVGVTGLEIKEACVAGREAQCSRAKYVESGKWVGAVTGAAALGAFGAKAARRGCTMVFGVSLKASGELVAEL